MQKGKAPDRGRGKYEEDPKDWRVPRSKRVRLPQSTTFRSLFFKGVGCGEPGSDAQLLHTSPNVYLIKSFLSKKEVDDLLGLIACHRKSFTRAYVDDDDGRQLIDDIRTNSFFSFDKSANELIRGIEQRAATLAGLSLEHVEPLQVVRYRRGQQYQTHHDAATLSWDMRRATLDPGMQRFVSIFVYLNSLPHGQGHTEFPNIGISVKPEEGSALMWCNFKESGSPDARVAHHGCKVTGEHTKYGLNIWTTDTVWMGH